MKSCKDCEHLKKVPAFSNRKNVTYLHCMNPDLPEGMKNQIHSVRGSPMWCPLRGERKATQGRKYTRSVKPVKLKVFGSKSSL